MGILGTRGTGNWEPNERPESWREMILYLLPNGDAPLMGLLSRMDPGHATDPRHSWFEKELMGREITVAGFDGNTGTITVASGAKRCPKGTLIMNAATSEVMRVNADPTIDTALVVDRNLAADNPAPAAPAANNVLAIFSSSYREGAPTPTPTGTNPTRRQTYTHIVRNSLGLTRTALQTSLRTGEGYRNAQIECLQIQSMEMEMATFLSVGREASEDNQMLREMRGIWQMLNDWAPDNVKNVGNFTEAEYRDYDKEIFDYGNDPKLAFVGSHGNSQLIRMGEAGGTFNYVYGDEHWGLRIREFTATGTLKLVKHPLFRHFQTLLDKEMLILDLPKVKFTPLAGKDMVFIPHRESNGDDERKDEYLVEFCVELHHPKAHYRMRNLGNYQ